MAVATACLDRRLMAVARKAACVEALDKIQISDPRYVEMLLGKAEVFVTEGNMPGALETIGHAITNSPLNPRPYLLRGNLLTLLNMGEAALVDYTSALERAPGHGGVYGLRARVHEQLGNLKLAETDFGHAMRLEPADAGFAFERAVVRVGLGRDSDAVRDLETAIELKPTKVRAILLLSRLHLVSDEPEVREPARGQALAEKALQLQDSINSRMTLALALAMNGERAEARSHIHVASLMLEDEPVTDATHHLKRQIRDSLKALEPELIPDHDG